MSSSHCHLIRTRVISRAGEKRGADEHRGQLLAGFEGRVV
jgi:hypothetical protein